MGTGELASSRDPVSRRIATAGRAGLDLVRARVLDRPLPGPTRRSRCAESTAKPVTIRSPRRGRRRTEYRRREARRFDRAARIASPGGGRYAETRIGHVRAIPILRNSNASTARNDRSERRTIDVTEVAREPRSVRLFETIARGRASSATTSLRSNLGRGAEAEAELAKGRDHRIASRASRCRRRRFRSYQSVAPVRVKNRDRRPQTYRPAKRDSLPEEGRRPPKGRLDV